MKGVAAKTKICSSCKRKRSLKFYYKRGKSVRSKCKDCEKAHRKIYEATPEFKKRHREKMAKWRKKHPIKAKRTAAKSRNKNKDRYNRTRRERYWSDPVYREEKHKLDREYLASGRRHFVRRRRQKAKAEELRRKVREWRIKNPEKLKAFYKRYRANVQNPREKEQRRILADQYIIKIIKRQLDYKIHTKDIPKELIKLERLRLLTKRKLKPLL